MGNSQRTLSLTEGDDHQPPTPAETTSDQPRAQSQPALLSATRIFNQQQVAETKRETETEKREAEKYLDDVMKYPSSSLAADRETQPPQAVHLPLVQQNLPQTSTGVYDVGLKERDDEGWTRLEVTSGSSGGSRLLEAVLAVMGSGTVTIVSHPSGRHRRNGRSRYGRRRSHGGAARRRARRRRREESSEPSMYEVVELDYQDIAQEGAEPAKPEFNWRIVPRYDLSEAETRRQEREVYHALSSETSPEESQRAGEEDRTCVACRESRATRAVVPCGHLCLCRPCALSLASTRSLLNGSPLPKRCPICQAAIGLLMRLR